MRVVCLGVWVPPGSRNSWRSRPTSVSFPLLFPLFLFLSTRVFNHPQSPELTMLLSLFLLLNSLDTHSHGRSFPSVACRWGRPTRGSRHTDFLQSPVMRLARTLSTWWLLLIIRGTSRSTGCDTIGLEWELGLGLVHTP